MVPLSEKEKIKFNELSARVVSGEELAGVDKNMYKFYARRSRGKIEISPDIERAASIAAKGYEAVVELEKDGVILSKEEKSSLRRPFVAAGLKTIMPERYDTE